MNLPPLIPRDLLFGNPDRAAVTVSPDGSQLAFLAPLDGVLNVWVAPLGDPGAARAVTHDTRRGIRLYFWAFTNQHIVYLQDRDGDENWRAYSVEVATGKAVDLTPLEGVQARIQQVSEKHPELILVELNDRQAEFHDLHRVNLLTGERALLLQNPGMLAGGMVNGFLTDDEFRVRFAMIMMPDGSAQILQPDARGEWEPFQTIPAEDLLTTEPVGFDKTNRKLYLLDSRGRDTAALLSLDLDSGAQQLLAADPQADISGLLLHPTERTAQAASVTYERQRWIVLDPAIQPDMEALAEVDAGELYITSRSLDDRTWIVASTRADGPVRYYLYDRPSRTATFLFTNRKDLEGLPLADMHPIVLRSRDGLNLVSYLTLPVGSDSDGDLRSEEPLPLVLYVHGGPWGRDVWGLNPVHQWLANRGYAVLSANFRASTGFGKAFVNAGDREWAGKMHSDLLDAVDWAIVSRIADPEKVAIMGGSYGGYATLVGLTFTPTVFTCGVDIVGPSNLITLLESIPPYWKPMLDLFANRVGDPRTEEGKVLLHERSPLTYADNICRPLLIGQGANDPRVKQAESDQIVRAMQEKEIPVTYVLFSDEGHGFARPENRLAFFAVAEAFLARHLGGQYEPIETAFEGSTVAVPEGAELVAGLAEALG